MAGQTKMIIITSDEDIIRQFTSNQNKNIQMTSIQTNDLKILNELIGATNDQVCKRAADTTDQNRSVKTRKISTDLICIICGDRAIGYNYGIISCASCKAFFHRNGQQDPKRFKCLTGNRQCIIEHKINRKCYRCRLERCLAMGMRKDFLLSQEEIQRRRNSSRNRSNSSILTVEDSLAIEKIKSSFVSAFKPQCDITNNIDFSNDTSELIGCLQVNNTVALHLIRFYRFINEFENLDVDDRFILIKYNLIPLFCILTCYRVKQPLDSDEDQQRQEDLVKRDIYILFLNVGVIFSEIVEDDPTLLSLLLVTFLFSKGLSFHDNEPFLKDSLSVYRAQSYYAKLLWNYMIKKHGETKTCKHFSQLMTGIFRAQSSAVKFREFLSNRMTTLDAVDEIAPLMQNYSKHFLI